MLVHSQQMRILSSVWMVAEAAMKSIITSPFLIHQERDQEHALTPTW